MPKTILMLSSKTYPCRHAMLESIYTEILPKQGYEIIWVLRSATDSDIKKWKTAKWKDTEVYVLKSDQKRNIIVKLLFRPFTLARVIKHIIRTYELDIIQVRNSIYAGIIAVYYQSFKKIPFIYQVSFPWAEMQIYRGGFRSMIGVLMQSVQRALLRRADLVLPISKWMLKNFEDMGIESSKMHILPLGADIEASVDKLEVNSLVKNLGLTKELIVLYFGEMGRPRKLDFLLRSFKLVLRKIPDVRLLMVGKSELGTDHVEWLKDQAVFLGISKSVIFTGHVPKEQIPLYILSSQVVVSPIPPIEIYKVSSPTKLFEAMALSVPVVGTDIPEQEMVLGESGAGIVTPYNEGEFAEAILWILRHLEAAKEMGNKGREYIAKHRSYEVLSRQMMNVYQTKILNTKL